MLYYLLKSLIVWMLSCYSETPPFGKPLFSSPWWVIWCSPAPGLWFSGYLTPVWSFFLSFLCPQVCVVPLFSFSLENILPLLLMCLSVQPEFWDSQLILPKSCILLIIQLESLNIATHETLVRKGNNRKATRTKKQTPTNLQRWRFLRVFPSQDMFQM